MIVKEFDSYVIDEKKDFFDNIFKTSSEIPFKNEKTGNHFRTWVNKYFPKYAKSQNLEKKGEFDNPHIKRAWKKYGKVYGKLTWKNITYLNKALTTSDMNEIASTATKFANSQLPKQIYAHRYSKHLYVNIDWFPDLDFGYFNLNTTVNLQSISFKFIDKYSFTASVKANITSKVPDGLFSGTGRTINVTPTMKGDYSVKSDSAGKFILSISPKSMNINSSAVDSGIGKLKIVNNKLKWFGATTVYNFGWYDVYSFNPINEFNKATKNKFKTIDIEIDPDKIIQTYADKVGSFA
jgi:hypothetical protein